MNEELIAYIFATIILISLIFLPYDREGEEEEEVEILCRNAMQIYKGDNTGYPNLIKSCKEKEDNWISKNL